MKRSSLLLPLLFLSLMGLCVVSRTISAYRIMAIPLPQGGHFNPMWQIVLRLAKHGHSITVFCADDVIGGRPTDIPEGVTWASMGPYPVTMDSVHDNMKDNSEQEGIFGLLKGAYFLSDLLSTAQVLSTRKLMTKVKPGEFDLILTDMLMASGFDMAHILDIPVALFFGSIDTLPILSKHAQLAMNYDSLLWDSRAPLGHNIKRFMHSFVSMELFRNLLAPKFTDSAERAGKELGIYGNMTFWEAYYNRPPPLVLVGSVPGLAAPSSKPPNVKWIGPAIPIGQEMPDKMSQWLSEKPVVYIAMGTVVTLNERQLTAFFNAAKTLISTGEYRVLWSLRTSLPESLIEESNAVGPDFRIEKFVPQSAVLEHSNIKAFISHCGFNSMVESLYWGTPVVCIPFHGDQPMNAFRLEDLGIGRSFDRHTFTGDDLVEAINDLSHSKTALDGVEQMSRLLRSGPPEDTVVREIEHVVRMGTTEHLRMPDAYYYAPMVLPMLYGMLLIIIPLFVLQCIKCCCFGHRRGKSSSSKKKQE